MSLQNRQTSEIIAREYLRPLFGFARKRTASLEEAEELTGEILVEIYESLSRNPTIRDLAKWVWSIAYHTHAKQLNRNERDFVSVGLSPDWFADRHTLGPEAEFVRNEMASEIRHDVAFLSETHHRIIVLRYFRGRKIREIAAALGLPEGTVKWHLSEIRNGFRTKGEQMESKNDMIGTLGCAPERLTVGMCGQSGSGVHPSKIVNSRLIPQNILLAAYSQARSTQEIAKELGIPTPYLTDEVKLLHDSELLWKTDDDRYITDFVITNKAMKGEWYAIIEEVLPWYIEETVTFFDVHRKELSEIIPQVEGAAYGHRLWTLIPFAFDPYQMIRPELSDDFAEFPSRKDGGKWIIMASHHETDQDDFYRRYRFTNMNGVMRRWSDGCESWALETTWTGFQTHRQNLLMSKWPQIHVLIDRLVSSDLRVDSINERDAELFADLSEAGILHSADGVCTIDVLWLDRQQLDSLNAVMAKYHEMMRESALREHHRFQQIVAKFAPTNVRSQVPAVAMLPVQLIAMFILNELSNTGSLPTLNERDKKRSMILLQGENRLRS